MRIRAVNCVLLACLAAGLAVPEAPRPKRHLQQWKDALLSKFFGNTAPKEENVRFYRIPGHDNILVKAVPKIDTIETAVVAPERLEDASPTIAILKSYLGTKSASETLSALQGVKHLLQSGILSVRLEPAEVVPYEKSAFLVPPFVSERIEFVQPRPAAVVSGPPKIPLIPVLPPAAEAPQVIEEIIPIKTIPTGVPELIPYPKFSYTQLKKDGTVVTHTVKDEISSDVIVTETNKPWPRPPSYIVDRFRKVFMRLPSETQTVQPFLPMPSPIPLDPIPVDVYNPSVIPPIPTMINVPKGEVQVHTYPAKKVNIDDKIGSFTSSTEIKGSDTKTIAEQPALLMPPPPPYIVDRIEKAAAISVKVKKPQKPSGFHSVNAEDYFIEHELLRNPGDVFYNPQSFAAPLTSEYIYRQPSPLKSNPFNLFNVDDYPVYITKAAATVKFNKNHAGILKPNDYYQQIENDYESKYSTNNWREVGPIVPVTKSVQQMPVHPVHIIERIQNAAAKAQSMPKVSRAYAFKINNPPFINSSSKKSTQEGTSYKIESEIIKPLKTKDKENLGTVYFAEPVPSSYVYRQISHSNPQPFTVVQVEDKTTYKPAGDVTIPHEHTRADGTVYKCRENHHVVAYFPEDYYYLPPVTAAEVHLPTTHKVEKLDNVDPQFSYVQVTSNGVHTYKDGKATFNDGNHSSNVLSSSVDANATSGKIPPKKNQEGLSGNPIVVPETTYSFTQTHSDGSTTNVRANSGQGVTVNVSERSKSSARGDIPEAFE